MRAVDVAKECKEAAEREEGETKEILLKAESTIYGLLAELRGAKAECYYASLSSGRPYVGDNNVL